MGGEIDEVLSDMDESESPSLGDEWRTWHMDNPELESDEAAEEGVKKKKEEGRERHVLESW